jgi:hypothetical protein
MRRKYRLLPKRQRAEVILSVLLIVAIAVVLVCPTARTAQSDRAERVFMLVENDFISPLFSSAVAIRKLNGLAKQVAQFAGYDDLRMRTELRGSDAFVNVTRFSGDLLAMLNVGFLLRTNYAGEAIVYINETLWDRVFARSSNVLNMTIKLHEGIYRIAGVTRDAQGLLAGTEVWMPIRSKSAFGELNSMRIVGALCRDCDWKFAQAQLSEVFERFMTEQVYTETKGAKMLPITNSVHFGESFIVFATHEKPETGVQLTVDYQPAALPSRRGS